MTIADRAVLVTGANRGIGQALVDEALRRGASGVDTDMSRDLGAPKASPESVARATFDGVDNGDEEIFPRPLSESMADSWRSGAAKALERQYAALTKGST